MAKVKLGLDKLTDDELIALAQAHKAAMVGNPNFPNPVPTSPAFDAALADLEQKVMQAEVARQAAKEATAAKNESRGFFEGLLTIRGGYIQETSGGSEPEILSAALSVQAAPTPVGQLPAPVDFLPTMGDGAGEMDLQWSPVYGASSYVIEYREQGTSGPWSHALSQKSRTEITGLVSGKTYVFRVAAFGTAGQGAWSAETARMAP